MTNRILSLAAFFALSFSISGQAATVYSFDYGRWHLKGYADVIDRGDNACVLSTEWNDGKKIQVNIFPKYDGSSNVTMTVLNPAWNNSSWSIDQRFNVRFDFASSQYLNMAVTGQAQIYSREKIILRGLNATFINYFVRYDAMTLFSGSGQQLTVNLEGTAALTNDLASCITTVLGTSAGGNH